MTKKYGWLKMFYLIKRLESMIRWHGWRFTYQNGVFSCSHGFSPEFILDSLETFNNFYCEDLAGEEKFCFVARSENQERRFFIDPNISKIYPSMVRWDLNWEQLKALILEIQSLIDCGWRFMCHDDSSLSCTATVFPENGTVYESRTELYNLVEFYNWLETKPKLRRVPGIL